MFPTATFLVAATLLAITPGPGVVYIIARTVSGGKVEGITSTLGAAVGGLIHVLAAALGLSWVIAKSALAFSIVKYLGVAYLVYLGIKILLSRGESTRTSCVYKFGGRSALMDGLIVELLNVKTAMFFLAFLPQFISDQYAVAPQFVMLGTIYVLLNSMVDVAAVFASSNIANVSNSKVSTGRLLTKVSGVVMLVLGFLVAARD
ncbi:LysE family translocator [Halomonas nitroreducens]|uniref:LysE family translocator n=1 Tax=Halomonas nitroreducens TaxID=447425 RepID=A0A431V2N8_9GAMM|nr:LysE family translocator [Halomonas nitroreducens]RTR02979.1 LysE family translocator [Halomonas nitroreducens]